MKNFGYITLALLIGFTSCSDDLVIEEPVQIVEQTDNKSNEEHGEKTTNAPEVLPCLDVVTQIVTSSTAYKKMTDGLAERIIQNGGTSYGITLEASPNPEKDKSVTKLATYDFNLHETYADRSPVIARYSFDPKTNELYEYDVVNDSLITIPFDKKLLSLITTCKN